MQNIEIWKQKYIETLSSKEKQSYIIAKEHLGMSFQLEKSVGFIDWYTKEQQREDVILVDDGVKK